MLRHWTTQAPRDREIAATLCSDGRGGQIFGSQSQGRDPYQVTLNVSCPAGYRALSVIHTHPGGVAVPSVQDMREARRLGLEHICVGVPETGEVRCWKAR
ncbi:MAG: Mov34/MPN/PAD-1 family protein [Chloroflexi bacterium]|nr:Mov34/MPN/PAD-1 family protein [Chloroflexota bacterium]